MNLLHLLSPFISLVPSIEPPKKKIPYSTKVYWTIVVLLIYLVFSQMPLFGINLGTTDPLHFIRVIMASNRGTLMEFGITPLMTSGLLLQLLTAAGLLSFDQSNPFERDLYEGAGKLLGILITFFQASLYVYSGMYGSPSDLGLFKCVLIVGQLLMAGLFLMLLDDLLQIGWGLGSGSSLFIACNYCEAVFWRCFSFASYGEGRLREYEGAVTSFVHRLLIRRSKLRALKESLFRKDLPNLLNLCATAVVFFVVVFLQGFKIDVPLSHVKYKGIYSSFPIKLFYTSSMPVMLQNAIVSNVMFISQLLFKRYPGSRLIRLLGVWESAGRSQKPCGGLAMFLSAPESIVRAPLHFVVYCLLNALSCGYFSRLWVEMGGSSPKDVAKRLKDQDLTVRGYRQESFIKVLYKYIPTAAWTGGIVIGIVTVLSEVLGAIGSGTGILLAVGTIFQYYETYLKEGQEEKVNFVGF